MDEVTYIAGETIYRGDIVIVSNEDGLLYRQRFPDVFRDTNKWARAIKARDKYTCRNCGAKKDKSVDNILAHHILPKGKGEMDTLENGMTLCSSCHNFLHKASKRMSRIEEIEAFGNTFAKFMNK